MKLLITGANGLLGVNLVRQLVSDHIEVKAFVRPKANVRGLEDVSCELFHGDISSYNDISAALKDCEGVVHAASTTNILPLEFEYFKKVNIIPTEHIVRAVLSQGNKRMVYVSTANTFAPGSKENPGSESSPFSLKRFNSGYINSKYIAQRHVLENVAHNGLNAVIVNPTFIIGPFDSKPSSGKLILHALKSGVQWCPAGGKNFVHVCDVARGIKAAFKHGIAGECYLLGGENLTYEQFFDKLNRITNRSPLRIKIPKRVLFAAGSVGQAWGEITGRKLALNRTNAGLLTLDNYYTGDKANKQFNLSPTPVEDAITEAVTWFKKVKYISQENYSTHDTSFDL
jgi:dihydroflavonol-4-reductase